MSLDAGSPLNIKTHAGATVGYEFMGDQVMLDRPDSNLREEGLTKELEMLLLADDWNK